MYEKSTRIVADYAFNVGACLVAQTAKNLPSMEET